MLTRTRNFRNRPTRLPPDRFRDTRPRTRTDYFLPSPTGDRNTFFIPDVPVFAAGNFRGRDYPVADLDDVVKNFYRLKGLVRPTLVIGHEEWQPLTAGPGAGASRSFRDRFATSLANTGIPAVGQVVGVRRRGDILHADFDRVPRVVRDLILAGAYSTISAEIYPRPPEGCGRLARGKVLRRVAALGGELPHLKSLPEIAALYSDDGYAQYFADRPGLRHCRAVTVRPAGSVRVKAPSGDFHVCFSEAVPMPVERKAVEDLLKKMNCWTPAMSDPKAYSDEALFDQVGFHVGNLAAALGDDTGYAGLGHDDLVAKVLELDPNQDKNQLDGMEDGDLRNLLAELEDGMTVQNHSDDTVGGGQAEDLVRKFSEMMSGFEKRLDDHAKKSEERIDQAVKRAEDAARGAEQSAGDRDRESHRAACFAELDRLATEGRLEPSELVDDPKDPINNPGLKMIAANLDYKNPVAKFKDAQGVEKSATQYDLFMANLRKRPVPEGFGRLPQTVDTFADTEMDAERKATEEYAKRSNESRRLAESRAN